MMTSHTSPFQATANNTLTETNNLIQIIIQSVLIV